jgi:hypothetical protein
MARGKRKQRTVSHGESSRSSSVLGLDDLVTTELDSVNESLVLLTRNTLGSLGLGEEGNNRRSRVSTAARAKTKATKEGSASTFFETLPKGSTKNSKRRRTYTTVILMSAGSPPLTSETNLEARTTSRVVTPKSLLGS